MQYGMGRGFRVCRRRRRMDFGERGSVRGVLGRV